MESSHDPATNLGCFKGLLLNMLPELSITLYNNTKVFDGMALSDDLATVVNLLRWMVLIAKGHHSKFGAIKCHVIGGHPLVNFVKVILKTLT